MENSVREAPQWEPHSGMDGRIEVAVHYYNDNSERVCFGGVSLRRYIELWDARKLSFQLTGAPRPAHLPTREQAHFELERELARAATPEYWAIEELPPARADGLSDLRYGFKMQAKPAALMPKPKKAPPKMKFKAAPAPKAMRPQKPKKEPPPLPPPPVWSPEKCAAKFITLKPHEQELLRLASEHKTPHGMAEKSAQVYFSGLCTLIGMPVHGKSFNRREALTKVFAAAKELPAPAPAPIEVRFPKPLFPSVQKKRDPAPQPFRVDEGTKNEIFAEYRRVAGDLKGRGKDITVPTLAEELKLPKVIVSSFLHQHPTLQKELKVQR